MPAPALPERPPSWRTCEEEEKSEAAPRIVEGAAVMRRCGRALPCSPSAAQAPLLPRGEGGERAMRLALDGLPEGRKVSYINAHGTSTPVGDVGEVEAVRRVFGEGATPPISSTKSMTGHSQGATGAQEAVYCLLALEHDFIIPSINVDTLDPALKPEEIATARVDNAGLDTVMTNSFGFGGTNGSMLLSKFQG